ncbi:hypothetical protein QYF61_024401 [Mycteria americana]|uniref:Uncharacterized protein n=1 Tax=Mycteria americana TaxID=33587 RepID=A0AAN7NW46_MYCAM|nr:hypothetical protein QYF61_024401 [Mycteria americana]
MMERGLVNTSASSLSTLGWISSGPIDFSSQSSLVSQAGLLPHQLVFRHLGTARSCAFRTSSLKNVQPSWTPLPVRAASQGTLSTSLLNRLKSALWKSKVAVSADPPHRFTTYQKLCHFVITLPKTASSHHIAHKSFSVREQEVQQGTFPRWLPHQLCQEVICHTLQEPPRLFPLCCIVFPADIQQLYMLSMTPYGVGYPFGQLGSAVPAVSPPNFSCTPSLFAGFVFNLWSTVPGNSSVYFFRAYQSPMSSKVTMAHIFPTRKYKNSQNRKKFQWVFHTPYYPQSNEMPYVARGCKLRVGLITAILHFCTDQPLQGQGYTGLENGSRAVSSEELWGVGSVILHPAAYTNMFSHLGVRLLYLGGSCLVAGQDEVKLLGKSPISVNEDSVLEVVIALNEKSETFVEKHYELWKGWRLNHFPGQPVPMLDNPFREVKFPNIQSKPPLVQLEAISSCPITCYLGEETNPHLSTTSFQAKQSQLPQPLLIRLLLQTLHQLRCPSLDTLQHLNVSLVVGGPKLNTVFEVRPHQCRVRGNNHFPSPAGHTISDTSQDAIGFLGHLGTLLAHIQAAVNHHPQVLLCWAAFLPLFPKPVALHGVVVAQVQDLALGLVEQVFNSMVDRGITLKGLWPKDKSTVEKAHLEAPGAVGFDYWAKLWVDWTEKQSVAQEIPKPERDSDAAGIPGLSQCHYSSSSDVEKFDMIRIVEVPITHKAHMGAEDAFLVMAKKKPMRPELVNLAILVSTGMRQATILNHRFSETVVLSSNLRDPCSGTRSKQGKDLQSMDYREGYRGGFCEKLLEASPTSDKANASWFQDGPTAGQGRAHQ